MRHRHLTRRAILASGAAFAAAAALQPPALRAEVLQPATRPIPSTGEVIPAIGLGTWITFNVGSDPVLRNECAAVIAAFLEGGGRMIDSSPMYGSSQPTIGYSLKKLRSSQPLFSAEKVWTSSANSGPDQIEQSRVHWGVPRFDLIQVHNLVSWKEHLKTLLAMKAAGTVRYVGITTSEGRRHDLVEEIMRTQPIDFVQVTYNVLDREVEARILPLAQDRGIGVIVNRPFREGHLIRQLARQSLPQWTSETGASTWAQYILRFIVSHPAVTCAIPATTRVDHVRENLEAATGIVPDDALRRRMAAYVQDL
jgi:diketogulonate reductase-like aldo/keto reductase